MQAPSRHRLGPAIFGWLVLPMMIALAWGQPRDGGAVAWCVANGALGMVALAVAVAIHELAHAAAARLLRLDLIGLWIGVGPEIARRTIRRVEVFIHAIPSTGRVRFVAHGRRWLRVRVWWVVFAGPASNLLLGAALVAWLAWLGRDVARVELTSGLAWWLMLGAINLALGVVGLLPYASSDGTQLLAGLLGRHDVDATLGAGHLRRGEAAFAAGRFDDALAAAAAARPLLVRDNYLCDHLVAIVALERDDAETAVCAFRTLRARPKLPPLADALFANNLAWALLVRGHADDVAEAVALSAVALAALPHEPSVHGTRGAALIAAGRADDGMPHSERGLAGARTDRNRAANHAWLAIAHAQRGALDAARASLDAARRAFPMHPLLPRAEAALAGRHG